jgi:hypothetical protein
VNYFFVNEGIIEIIIRIPDIKKIECKDIIKLFIVMSFEKFEVENDDVKIL